MKSRNANNFIYLLGGMMSLLIGLFLTFTMMPDKRDQKLIGQLSLTGYAPELRGDLS